MSDKKDYLIKVVNEDNSATGFHCRKGDHLLQALLASKSKSVIVGCRGGGCGVCKVQILSGHYSCQKMSSDHICAAEQDRGIVLACRTYPQSDISFKAAQPKFLKAIHKRKCIK